MLRNTEHLKVFKEKYYIQEERKPITKNGLNWNTLNWNLNSNANLKDNLS